MFLPAEFRSQRSIEEQQKWNLLKPQLNEPSTLNHMQDEILPDNISKKKEDDFLIPLKKLFKSEKKQLQKKMKKVNFSEMISDFAKSKEAELEAIGDCD